MKTADCVIGPGDTIIHDERLTKKLDAETELAIVIGKAGRHIPVERALEHVFGYTVANDVTARERQVRRNEQGFTWYEVGRGKAFETACPLGPCIVTADEIPDPQKLRLRTRINGELRQSASTGNMIFSCAHLIHFFSISFTLKPGFVILTGTPGGTAWSMDPELGGKWVGGDGSEHARAGEGLPQAGRRDRERAREDRGAAEHGRHGLRLQAAFATGASPDAGRSIGFGVAVANLTVAGVAGAGTAAGTSRLSSTWRTAPACTSSAP